MIPSTSRFDQETMTAFVDADPLVKEYRAFFALLDWQVVHTSQARHSGLGRPGHPLSVYVKACLLRLKQGLQTATQLRHFLLTHPLLVIDLGFRLVLDPSQPHGFDVERTIPCAFWWRKQLRDAGSGTVAVPLARDRPGTPSRDSWTGRNGSL